MRDLRTATASKLKLLVVLSDLLLLLVFTFTAATAQRQLGFRCNYTSTSRCKALVGYICPKDTTLSNITNLFGIEGGLHSLLVENSLPLNTTPDQLVAAKQTIRIPFNCSCSNGTGISDKHPIYKVTPSDGLANIAENIFSFLVFFQQIATVNKIADPNKIEVGQELWIPLPCSCDPVDGVQVVHYGQVLQFNNSLEMIAQEFGTTTETLLKLNGLDNVPRGQTVIDVPLGLPGRWTNFFNQLPDGEC
ncbi:Peptidoglycan-binding lysin domain [Macleaya cordata]|uniref:Peptidoglycan-binding lysin domain n=1 Tax=Macleaya cordata TaxID=56857 RepID=A0A200QL09_MACCD|nr:Peptidoglycan-binding lysin domain [Macleaya cordata]